jgi:hypothetical protein
MWLHASVVGAVVLAASTTLAQERATADLEVRRVTVFSSGVAFFEREGTVTGNAMAELTFRTDQVNDILKSLVVEDLGGGRIGAVNYASRDPVEKTLRSFAVDISDRPTLPQLMDRLRGEPVEISGTRQISGTIVGIETVNVIVGDQTVPRAMLNVLTDGGLVSLPLHELQGVRLVNPRIDGELRAAFQTLAGARDADRKTVSVHFDGEGQRRVRVRYLLEAPIWKTSYRLVLPTEGKPYLQGWATVENATEADWSDVNLALVSGRPVSFRMDLYTPLYVSRPMEELELYAGLRPPTYAGGVLQPMDALLSTDDDSEGIRRDRAKMMERASPQRGIAGRPAAAPPGIVGGGGMPAELALADAFESTFGAVAGDVGELFSYAIDKPVSIARQHSAMLPIVTADVAVEKVSIYNPGTHPKHPFNGLVFENTTDLKLMQGPVTVFDGGTYAGDAKLPNLQRGEKRLVSYALDLATEVSVENRFAEDELSLRIAKGTLVRQWRSGDEREYKVTNRDARARTLIIEHPLPDGWELVEPKDVYERAAGLVRFKVTVEAGKSATLKARQERVRDEWIALSDTGLEQIDIILRSRVISPAVKDALQKLAAMRKELSDTQRDQADAERRLQAAIEDQERVRRNVSTLDRSSDAYNRQLKKLDELETTIEQTREEVDGLAQKATDQAKAIETYLLALDVK